MDPAEPPRRYERQHPGELIHIDIKKLGRFNTAAHCVRGERREEWCNAGFHLREQVSSERYSQLARKLAVSAYLGPRLTWSYFDNAGAACCRNIAS